MTEREAAVSAGAETEPTECFGTHDPFATCSRCDDGRGAQGELPQALDYEAMRIEKGWPTPDSMREAADGLDKIAYPKYGDILRWVADLCDGSLPNEETP